ncbi:hypothetical protein ACOME3_003642 [Neoechinorhynchus agilis]
MLCGFRFIGHSFISLSLLLGVLCSLPPIDSALGLIEEPYSPVWISSLVFFVFSVFLLIGSFSSSRKMRAKCDQIESSFAQTIQQLTKSESRCCSLERKLRANAHLETEQADRLRHLNEELDNAKLSEKMYVGRLRTLEHDLSDAVKKSEQKDLKVEEMKKTISSLEQELAEVRLQSEMKQTQLDDNLYKHSNSLVLTKDKMKDLERTKDQCESSLVAISNMRLSVTSQQFDNLEAMFNDLSKIFEQASSFSLTRLDSILIDPLDTHLTSFVKAIDLFKQCHLNREDNRSLELSELLSDIRNEADKGASRLRGQISADRAEIISLKMELERIQKDLHDAQMEVRFLTEMRERDVQLHCQSLKNAQMASLSEYNGELDKLRERCGNQRVEIESLKRELDALKDMNENRLSEISRLQIEMKRLTTERDRLTQNERALSRRVCELEAARHSQSLSPNTNRAASVPVPDLHENIFHTQQNGGITPPPTMIHSPQFKYPMYPPQLVRLISPRFMPPPPFAYQQHPQEDDDTESSYSESDEDDEKNTLVNRRPV